MRSVRTIARACPAALLSALVLVPVAHGAITIDESTRKVETPSLRLTFDANNPEQLNTLEWGPLGGVDLAAGGAPVTCGGVTDEAQSWGEAYGDPSPNAAAEVAAGSRGQWRDVSDNRLQIDSQITAAGCTGNEGNHPVQTIYRFYDSGPHVHELTVRRRFGFGPDPTLFTQGHLRPYTPRMPYATYPQTLWPKAGALQTSGANDCAGNPCLHPDWDGTWYAQHDPATGHGLLVVRSAKSRVDNPAVRLIVDWDSDSGSNNSSADLIEPAGTPIDQLVNGLAAGDGWTGPVTETESLCFYSDTTWTPQQRAAGTPPSWCGEPPTPQLTIAGATVAESAGTATLTVTRSNTDAAAPTFDVATANGTAAASTDYGVADSGAFAPGATTATVTVPIINDTSHEETETFTVALHDVTGATAGGPATVTITDDDAAPTPNPPSDPNPLPTPGSTGTPPVTGSGTSVPKPLKASDYITLPSAKRCVSRRSLRIRLKHPKGIKIKSATVKVNGRLVKTVKGARVTAPVDLRGLPRGRFTVSIVVTTTTGKTVKDTRTYRTCAVKAKHKRR